MRLENTYYSLFWLFVWLSEMALLDFMIPPFSLSVIISMLQVSLVMSVVTIATCMMYLVLSRQSSTSNLYIKTLMVSGLALAFYAFVPHLIVGLFVFLGCLFSFDPSPYESQV